ncbi:hypothetical protein L873DRAFT_826093 [Choiromyces venosus 120613-1]|uniref:Uncharacterized protein n=1 Tax=Choiromyces venosus 120613-1 TaxID=1336337 RepID=A0A3N4JPW1_9PEZI|nr:hypothetical protein L873DRAFT_826093 [Choiromyces venosus 120613-1]
MSSFSFSSLFLHLFSYYSTAVLPLSPFRISSILPLSSLLLSSLSPVYQSLSYPLIFHLIPAFVLLSHNFHCTLYSFFLLFCTFFSFAFFGLSFITVSEKLFASFSLLTHPCLLVCFCFPLFPLRFLLLISPRISSLPILFACFCSLSYLEPSAYFLTICQFPSYFALLFPLLPIFFCLFSFHLSPVHCHQFFSFP